VELEPAVEWEVGATGWETGRFLTRWEMLETVLLETTPNPELELELELEPRPGGVELFSV